MCAKERRDTQALLSQPFNAGWRQRIDDDIRIGKGALAVRKRSRRLCGCSRNNVSSAVSSRSIGTGCLFDIVVPACQGSASLKTNPQYRESGVGLRVKAWRLIVTAI